MGKKKKGKSRTTLSHLSLPPARSRSHLKKGGQGRVGVVVGTHSRGRKLSPTFEPRSTRDLQASANPSLVCRPSCIHQSLRVGTVIEAQFLRVGKRRGKRVKRPVWQLVFQIVYVCVCVCVGKGWLCGMRRSTLLSERPECPRTKTIKVGNDFCITGWTCLRFH